MNQVRVLLVHGSFHGAWCWDHLIPELAARNVDAHAIELPFTSLADDATAVASAIEECEGPLVVVGHSYGGAVVTLGAGPDNGRRGATHLVYLAAILTDPTQPLDLKPTPGMSGIQIGDDGMARVDPSTATQALFHRCPPELAKLGHFTPSPDAARRLRYDSRSTADRMESGPEHLCALHGRSCNRPERSTDNGIGVPRVHRTRQ